MKPKEVVLRLSSTTNVCDLVGPVRAYILGIRPRGSRVGDLECRHWADVILREHRDNPLAVRLARHLATRSHKLESMGLELCKEGVWPIKGSTQEPKVKLQ